MGGGYFIFCCNMKVVCVILLVAFCAVHAKRDAYLDILADEFEKMGMMDEDGGWDELEKPVPNAKPEEPEPAVGPGKPELPTVKPKKQEPPTAKPEKPEPPTAEPEKPEPPTAEPEKPELPTAKSEKPEPPTAEPERPKPTEEIDEAFNGEQGCEGHGFQEEQCLNISCCQWDVGQCWSAVGQDSCDGNEWDKPEKPEPTAEPERPKPTEEIDEAAEEAGDHFLSGILLPIKGKRSCHHRGCYLCYHKCLPCLECIDNDHPACALCHKCAPCTQCLHCFDLKNSQYLF